MLDGVDVVERVVGCGDDVGVFAGLDAAENFGFAEQVGGAGGGGLNGLHRRHAVLHHECELADAAVVFADAGIGAEAEFHSGVEGFREILALLFAEFAVVFEKIGGHAAVFAFLFDAFLVVNIHIEIGAMLFGEGDAFVVDERGVFDAGDACADGVFDAFGRVGVGGDAEVEVVRFIDGGGEFFRSELLVIADCCRA